MDRGLYLAASGMLAEQIRQDQIANDLANASTAGYKAERTTQQSFGEMLLTNSVTGQQVGRVTTGVAVTNTQSPTGRPACSRTRASRWTSPSTATASSPCRPTPARATRATASSPATPQGRLTTLEGDLVLGRNGQPVTLGADGKVDPRTLNVVTLNNPEKVGNSYVTGTPGNVAGQTAGSVRAGALEASGADPTQTMVDMMASYRAYESGQKVIHTIDETLGKAASSVGSLT